MEEYDRREFLSLSLPGFLGVITALPALCSLATRAYACNGRLPEDEKIHWEAFLEAVSKEAEKQHLDAWNQDTYVQSIAKLASQLHLGDPKLAMAMEQLKIRLKNGRVDFDYLEKRIDFSLCLLQFDQDEFIRPHDHPEMTGMILCGSGEIETANYDPTVLPDHNTPKGHQLLKHTATNILKKNDISTLTAKTNNIHTLKALKPTQLIDIFTPPYDKERIEKSRWFDISQDPLPNHKTIFEAKVS
jgi:hypothetical protein